MTLELKSTDLTTMVIDNLKDGKQTVIKVSTTWCKPCAKIRPLVDEIAKRYKNKVVFYEISNYDKMSKTDKKNLPFRVHSYPSFIFYRNGVIVKERTCNSKNLEEKMCKYLDVAPILN
jgi:thiol-disulfide isomerase/thioredoxin